jgi:hypothetical protein
MTQKSASANIGTSNGCKGSLSLILLKNGEIFDYYINQIRPSISFAQAGGFIVLFNDGRCCWNLYPQPDFKRGSKKIELGFSG